MVLVLGGRVVGFGWVSDGLEQAAAEEERDEGWKINRTVEEGEEGDEGLKTDRSAEAGYITVRVWGREDATLTCDSSRTGKGKANHAVLGISMWSRIERRLRSTRWNDSIAPVDTTDAEEPDVQVLLFECADKGPLNVRAGLELLVDSVGVRSTLRSSGCC